MTTFFGRRVLTTTLDPLPPAFRLAPGVIAINGRELDELKAGNAETMKMLAALCYAEDSIEASKRTEDED